MRMKASGEDGNGLYVGEGTCPRTKLFLLMMVLLQHKDETKAWETARYEKALTY